MEQGKYPAHAIIEKLGDTPAIKLLGYFGGTTGGVVRIYSDLDDLSAHFEVKESDILHVEEAPEELLPHGGSAIWVKADADIDQCASIRTTTQAKFLGGAIAAQMTGGAAAAARARAPVEPDTAHCDGFSVWPCSVAWGACLPSGDGLCVNTQQWGCQILSANSCVTCAGFTCVAECNTHNPQCPPQPTQFCTSIRVTQCCPILTRVHCQVK